MKRFILIFAALQIFGCANHEQCQLKLREQERKLNIECDAEKERLCDELDIYVAKIFCLGADTALAEIVRLDAKLTERGQIKTWEDKLRIIRSRIVEKNIVEVEGKKVLGKKRTVPAIFYNCAIDSSKLKG